MRIPTLIWSIIHHSIRLTKSLLKLLRRLSILVLCSGLLFSVVGSPISLLLTVNADNDDEYIQFNDYETAQAYRFWSLYGLTPDTSSTYTQTYTTTGTTTQSAQVSLVGSGSEGGTFSLQDITAKTIEWWKADQYVASTQLQNFINNLEIKVEGDPNDKRDQMSLHFGACKVIGQTTNANGNYMSYNLTCDGSTDNYYYNNTTYEIEFNSDIANISADGNGGVSGTAGIFIRNAYGLTSTDSGQLPTYGNYRTEYDGLGSISLQETFNESGTISSTGTITTTTTTTNINSLKYVYPVMKGTFDNTLHNQKRFINRRDENRCFTIAINTLQDITLNDRIKVFYYTSDGSWIETSDAIHNIVRSRRGGANILTFDIYDLLDAPSNSSMYINVTNFGNSGFIPLYVGYKDNMSDGIYRYIYGFDRNIEAIQAQTQKDQEHYEEVMSTDEISDLGGVSENIIDTGTEKMGDLLFPIQHVIDTADELANVNATGQVRLPAIFADGEYWILDLTVFERKLPQAWTFIQSLCQLAVAIYMIHGLYNLIAGGLNDDS